ncbi:right-handed parallel beta-helix repeat-containing protein [Micromonospora sp. C97]|uniref:right-handed parallel beta-helix repeat-containing protein n=1 Tax=Micromonospora sp. C97 TaxID=2824883 RepID=UPI001B395CFF|nr:right-handed parallel beta-helix repeat-containing protein [Micromonospora sp. C97]MBQ1032485.1 right-handed parallel beta-helix repeat-containing protein [Micromonospora sp. C97]
MTKNSLSRRALLYGTPVLAGAAALTAAEPAMAAGSDTSVVSPKDYGAVGDGVTDDTAAVQRCLSQGRAVDFGGPGNVYLITNTLTVYQATPQILRGHGATIKAGAAANLMRLGRARHSLDGLNFDGTSQPGGVGVIIEGDAQYSSIVNCRFTNIGGSGVSVSSGAHHVTVTGCFFDHCGHGSTVADNNYRSSIYVADADFCVVTDNRVLNCNWGIIFRGDSAAVGINFYTCQSNVITAVSPPVAISQGISNRYGRNGKIAGNTVIGFDDNSIDCWGCNTTIIAGNSTKGGKDGVFVGDPSSSNIVVNGNTFNGPQRGVRVFSQETVTPALVIGVTIVGNTITQPTDGGVLISRNNLSQVTGITVSDNDIHVTGAGSYGVKVVNAELVRVLGNRIYRPLQQGIHLSGVDITEVAHNTVSDAGYQTPNTYSAIDIVGSNRVTARDNVAYGNAKHAVAINSGVGMTVTGTRWRSLGAGGISNGATGTVLADNVQF